MKNQFTPLPRIIASVTALVLSGFSACAVTFTNDTAISFDNTNYDGLDVAVTNCTLTVDGVHAFASLQVLAGANLTHTYAPGGLLTDWITVTNEAQVLSVTNAATLANLRASLSTLVVQDTAGQVTYSNGVDYVASTDASGITTLLLTTNSAIAEGSTNLVSYQYLITAPVGLSLTVTGDVTVAQGGAVNADGRGYSGGQGPGHGYSYGSPASGSGGGHGGFGGLSGATGGPGGGVAYDSIQLPAMLGSGGGGGVSGGSSGAAGGGSIKLIVGGVLRVDGMVSASGTNAFNDQAGGGSGGSIWLSAQTFVGSGMLIANGGAGEPSLGGGGGGGRISLQYGASSFTGTLAARGGSGYVRGGAGTIYTRVTSQTTGQLLVDNGGRAGSTTSLSTAEALDLTVQGGAIIPLLQSQTVGNLLIGSNAWISLTTQTLTVLNNATIQAGGGITADGAGSPAGSGTGAGRGTSSTIGFIAGGGGYGGYGAAGGAPAGSSAYGGIAYGPAETPVITGSGGGSYSSYCIGGAGGGAALVNVTGMLLLDGRISADGSPGVTAGGGGGSGGSVWLTVGTLAGAGTISANGGLGNGVGLGGGGGGGGGRIAVQYAANVFFGTTTARGGGGAAYGGAGTIYTKGNTQPGLILADNGGQAGTNTTFTVTGMVDDLTVKGGAVVSLPTSDTIGNLLVASNGWVSITSQTLTVTGNATVQAGGGIIADGTGNPAGQGSGAGRYNTGQTGAYVGGGGGYGGYGASGAPVSTSPSPSGGSTYGSVITPTDLGSGGGSYYSPSIGGAGGGAIRLSVTGVLQVDGRISAAGAAAPGASGGGGSGGTVSLTVGTLTGSGTISVNGGAGNFQGGGGGGGRVAINYTTSDFSGLISAYGGGGYATGGAGTIYTKAYNQSGGLIVADNGGQTGTNTTLAGASSTVDLTVRGGAVVSPYTGSSWPAIGTLLIASNGWVVPNGYGSTASIIVSGNATIQAGGGITADGTGYASGAGNGSGKTYSYNGYVGGGGGYGGYGASGAPATGYTALGGTYYGVPTAPVDLGSGGGGSSPGNLSAPGGSGGGAVHLTVTGTLEVDGRISARGLPGGGPSAGGGSGGSIYLTVGSLAGAGAISANGGAGIALGGGGSGGRIAISYTGANTFSGLMSAYGGGGYGVGGAGTIYTSAGVVSLVLSSFVLDNGGQAGTNTGWPAASSPDITLRNGATLAMPIPSTTINNLVIGSNSWIYVSGNPGIYPPTLTVRGNLTIQAGGGINADGGGYSYFNGGLGQGAGGIYTTYGSGGGFGGCGGPSGGTQPIRGGQSTGTVTAGGAGSAGGTSGTYFIGGSGGGAISLNVTGVLQVDGRISSAGGAGVSANSGGGSGGGIALTVGTLAGAGVIAANGGAGNGLGSGGGGGRIAITYTANAFSGLMSAYGGGGYSFGGAGTIYTKAYAKAWGQVLADNGGQAGTNTSWYPASTFDLTVTGGAIVALQNPQTFGNLLITSNAWISMGSESEPLTVTSNATIQAGGGIIADGAGYTGTQGPGAGRYVSQNNQNIGSGGGYGGYGALCGVSPSPAGGNSYGSVTGPIDLGSPGGGYGGVAPGGAGGGAIRLTVTGALLVNGRISANGAAGFDEGAGGGSGGSVWLTTGTLAGAGTISANGGAGNWLGGGGGGGRVAIFYGVNAFAGTTAACGGGGYAWGGAGTVYTKANSQTTGQMLVDNGGHSGTNTPVALLSPFDLTVRGGAVANAASSYLVLSNLSINSGGAFTCLSSQTNLELEVLRNATIDTGSFLTVDNKGFAAGAGLGAGLTKNNIGSGAGYGGSGGASSMSAGGATYGSVQQPVDRGSGGGLGWGTSGGGEGGGAIRLTVGGALTVNGRISAGGDAGIQDESGAGSGGSVWLMAGTLAGNGAIAADGGAGELYDGGGGGGGRVAIYAPLNAYEGVVSVAGGAGWYQGQTGSVYYAGSPLPPQVVSFTPSGVLTAAVSAADIYLSTPINPYSVSAQNFTVSAPGNAPLGGLMVTVLGPTHLQVSFAPQTAQGAYTVTMGPQVTDLYGQPMAQGYTNTFTIAWAYIQGAVTDTNGVPVAGVLLQPDGGLPASTTDTNGLYTISVPPGGGIVVVPSGTNLTIVPSSRTYVNVTVPFLNENYRVVASATPVLTTSVTTNGPVLSWYGIAGMSYQPLYSTNLTDWQPYTASLLGTNGLLQLALPTGPDPLGFFRVWATY
jgi:hypothetical protein